MRTAAKPGQFVLIKVTDTGTGIPAEISEKIFDPFFSTKEPGKGTGLGLATVLRIVEGHGGFVEVESQIGRGTTFKVYLPAVEAGQSIVVEAETKLPAGHGELILVVDDEASLLEITREALEAHGYTVLMAGDGTEAVAQCAEHSGKIQAVLTDLMMPHMSGQATIRVLRKMYPQTKIIAISGTVEGDELLGFAKEDTDVFLSKPFTAEQLLKTLAEVLGI
jgi:CheY-like chemotaxis protein